MANPQKENGFVPIATEIVQAMQKTHWTEYETRILWCIFEKTYGWHKKEDWISLSQLSEMTGILRHHIARTITRLKSRNIIVKNKNKTRFNKDYEQWDKPVPNEVVPNEVRGGTQRGTKGVPNEVHTKDSITKETIQKKDERNDFSFLTDDKKKYTDVQWRIELLKWRKRGYETRGKCKLIPKKNGELWLLDILGKWTPYNKKEYLNNLLKKHGNISRNK